MFKVRQTWNQHFPGRKLYALDVRVNNIDHAWPLSAPVSSVAPSIHVNPRFLAQKDETLPLPDVPLEDDEAEMRRQLIAKQAELLRLQQKRLELELKETETRLAQQKKQSTTDLFIGVEPPTTQTPASTQAPLRDPRIRDNRDPRLASRDPRVCRDPRVRNKPVTAELLPQSTEVQPGLTFFGPVTNQPLNQFGISPKTNDEPPQIDHISNPHSMPTLLPHPMPQVAPNLTDFGNQNNPVISVIKQESAEQKQVSSPKKDTGTKLNVDVKPEKSPEKLKEEPSTVDKVKVEVSPKDKKPLSDPRRAGSETRSKDSKERDVDLKTTSSRSHTKISRDSKARNDSKERSKSRTKDDTDKGKSRNEEEKNRGKSVVSDNQRPKGKRTRGDMQEENRKKSEDQNVASDVKEKEKNLTENRSRRSKSPKLSRERSRSPVRDSGKGSKPTRKIKTKTESKSEQKLTELPKTDLRKPISSLPRIPKRTDNDDKDERTSNKRDLEGRNDYKDPERSSKKPRISQERDVIEPVHIHTKNMNEDISELFGCEDQDYRHPDIVSPRGGGWARYKADHPQDFDNRRSSMEDVDHRRDTDYRPYNGPAGYIETRRSGPPPLSDPDVPQELRLENREKILNTMEMRRKSGEISHEELQKVLRDLSEFDALQELKRKQNTRQEPPHLEPEVRDDRYPLNRLSDEPLMEYHSPRKEARHGADWRPGYEDLPREHGPPRGPGYDDLPHGPTRGLPLDRDHRRSDRPPYRGPDRHHDERLPYRVPDDRALIRGPDRPLLRELDRPNDDRPPLLRGRDFDGPGRPLLDHPPSLLGPGPGPRIRPEQDTSLPSLDPIMHYDIDHRKLPQLDRGPIPADRRPLDVEAGRSPTDRPIEERPSLLGPGPASLREKEMLLKTMEDIPKLEPEKHDRSAEVKIEAGGLAVGGMLEKIRAESTPENSLDIPERLPKTELKHTLEDVPKLLPKPVYDPTKDDRWLIPSGVHMRDGALNIFPEGTEEIVLNGQPFPYRLGGPKCIIHYRGEQLEVFIDPTRRMLHINGTLVYKVSDPVKEVSWGPGPHERAQVFYHGNPRNLWIDGFLYVLRIDAPPKIIRFREKDHTIMIDGRDGMILINKHEFGTYGGKPRFVRLDGERVELRFTPPPKNIVIDGEQCQIRLDRKIPFIVMKDVARGIRFDGPPREVIINNQKFFIPTDRAVEVRIDNAVHMVAFGGPSHEIIVDGIWHEMIFNGPPKEITAGNQKLLFALPTPPPDVKILDPIENQKLKDLDVDIRKDDRNSPVHGRPGSKPVSILDLNVSKPTSLKNERYDRRRRSPQDDDRSSSPDRHRRRRHRDRRSPNRRRRGSPPIRDDRRHGSPLNEPIFNGPPISQPGPPVNLPPFGPQGPNPLFNPGAPNQPFQPRPNQPFPPNQQFPGPNQAPFPRGPNPMFPTGPNQPPFPGGQNQPFQPGPNQQFQQIPNQPGPVPINQFPAGPRPLMQDENSNGPHPMFNQGPNMQPMPPLMNQLIPGQVMPAVSVPASLMNQSQVPVSINPPSSGIPGLMQPPILQPEPLNVESLLQKLISVGLINAKTDTTSEKSDNKEPDSRSPKKQEEGSGKEKKKPVRIKPSKVEKIPDLTEMKGAALKHQYNGVIQMMYSGIQCTSCGTRFMASQTTMYREHLDWHFRQNQREKKGAKISRHRSWFYELDDWLNYEEVGDAEERARTNLFEQAPQEPVEKEPTLPQREDVLHCPAATEDDAADACVVCGDVFEQFWDEESEEWHLKNALRSAGKTYHPVCYEDAQESTTNTPKEDPGANPMLLQIQKELGYVPADTVVSFPAANVISISQHDHSPKDLVIDKQVTESEKEVTAS